jgi:tetratricopeptide (TPR) repeat protein
MKKMILIMVLVLVIVYAALAILGAGGEYAAEKLLYSAVKMNEKIVANPDVVPPKLVDSIENEIKKLLKKYPDTEVAKTANIKLAEFYIAYKKYGQALAQADKAIKKYEKNTGISSMAYFLKGVAYEKQDKWQSALKEYHLVRDSYRDTQLGMRMPIYIANYYSQKGKNAQAEEAYGEAARFYENIEKENSKKPLGYMASLFLVQTYIKADNFERAAGAVEETLKKYFSQMALVQLLPLVETIIVTKLKNPERAVEIYKTILAKSKDEKLNKVLQARVEALQKDKK